MHDPARSLRPLPLDAPEPSPENVRKAPPDEAALAGLEASISAHGRIGNLVVRPVEDDPRRYAAKRPAERLSRLNDHTRRG